MPPSERRVFMSTRLRASSVPTDPRRSRNYANQLASLLARREPTGEMVGYRLVTATVSPRLPSVGAGLQQPVLLALLPQVLARNTQDLRGPLDVAAGVLEGVANVFALGVSERQPPRQLELVGTSVCARGAVEPPERRQVRAFQAGPVAEDHGALDHVAQLACIARPIPSLERLQGVCVDGGDVLLELPVEPLAEVIGEERQVALDLAEGGQRHGGNTGPIKQGGPEIVGLDLLLEGAVRGGEQEGAHPPFAWAPEAPGSAPPRGP